MVSSIQLGNFFSFGGRTVSGSAGGSGIDTESLIKGLTDAKLIPATKLEDQIKPPVKGKVTGSLGRPAISQPG